MVMLGKTLSVIILVITGCASEGVSTPPPSLDGPAVTRGPGRPDSGASPDAGSAPDLVVQGDAAPRVDAQVLLKDALVAVDAGTDLTPPGPEAGREAGAGPEAGPEAGREAGPEAKTCAPACKEGCNIGCRDDGQCVSCATCSCDVVTGSCHC